jgi:hypothetical protein
MTRGRQSARIEKKRLNWSGRRKWLEKVRLMVRHTEIV